MYLWPEMVLQVKWILKVCVLVICVVAVVDRIACWWSRFVSFLVLLLLLSFVSRDLFFLVFHISLLLLVLWFSYNITVAVVHIYDR